MLTCLNKQNGIESVIKTLDEVKELLPPDNKSAIWKRGFRNGANAVRFRIKRAYEKEGNKEMLDFLKNIYNK